MDFRQLVVEGIGFYRVASGGRADNPAHLDVLAGVRYLTVRTRLKGETDGRRSVRHVLPGPRLGGRSRRRQVPGAARLEDVAAREDRHRRLRLEPDLEPRGRPGLPGVPRTGRSAPAGATRTSTTTRARGSSGGRWTSPTADRASGSPTPGSRRAGPFGRSAVLQEVESRHEEDPGRTGRTGRPAGRRAGPEARHRDGGDRADDEDRGDRQDRAPPHPQGQGRRDGDDLTAGPR